MEELFKQSFNFAHIKVFKNYSNIGIKQIIEERVPDPAAVKSNDLFANVPMTIKRYVVSAVKEKSVHDIVLYNKDNKHFFYTDNPTESFIHHGKRGSPTIMCEGFKLVNAKPIKNPYQDYFVTSEDRHIKRHYNNPFASIETFKIERWIKRDGDKVTIKCYVGTRNRNANCIYFSKSTESTTITFNLKTANFTIVTYTSGRGKKEKKFHCNSFNSLRNAMRLLYNMKYSHCIGTESGLYKDYLEVFNPDLFQMAVKDALGLDGISFETKQLPVVKITSIPEMLSANFNEIWMNKFVEIKKIKLPNDGTRLIECFYPTERYLKKNDRKLIAAVLDRFGVKSNLTVKILHKFPHISIHAFVELCRLFGDDFPKYIGNIIEPFFRESREDDHTVKYVLLDPERSHHFILQDTEKENVVHILNDLSVRTIRMEHTGYYAVHSIVDHFKMMEKIRPYYPDLRLNARKWETFNTEHSLYSKYEREIMRGHSLEITFDPQVIQAIEKPIELTVLDQENIPVQHFENELQRKQYVEWFMAKPVYAIKRAYFPKLLVSSEDYSEEGATQNHCVAGYITNVEYSIIVSLRTGTERVTCEYRVRDKKCVQAQYYHNNPKPEHFKEALKILDDRMKSIPLSIKPIEMKRVPLVINGIEVKPQEDVVVTEIEPF